MKKQLLVISAITLLGLHTKAQTILGVDVSSYQGNPTWTSVKSAGFSFAYAKATEGDNLVDGSYAYNMAHIAAAGLKMGSYHFCDPIDDTYQQDAAYFLKTAKAYINSCNMPPMLDVEDTPGDAALSTMGGTALTAWVVGWCQTIKDSTGITPVIYTDGSYAALMQAGATKYGLWIATVSGSPTIGPTSTGSWSTWEFNQYSWTGTVSGISGQVDEDVFNGNAAAFAAITPCSSVTANFIASQQTGCVDMTVNFTDKSTTTTGTLSGWKWTFQGGTPGTATTQNATVTYNTAGTYYVKEVVTSTTGKDSVTVSGYIHVIPTGTLPLSETFQSATFPPTGWTMNYPVAGDSAWELCKTDGFSSTQCMYFPANCGQTVNIAGQRQQIYTPDYSFASVTNAGLTFEVAYEPSNLTSTPAYSDTLVIYSSTDCGSTWKQIYSKGGATLCTTGSTTGANTDVNGSGCFVPPAGTTTWRKDSIALSSLNGQANVMFSFESRSGWGNIYYLDNINITSAGLTSLQDVVNNENVKVFPNPNNGTFTIEVNGESSNDKVQVGVYDLLGQQVYLQQTEMNSSLQVDLGNKASGIYFYRIMSATGDKLIAVGKVMVQK